MKPLSSERGVALITALLVSMLLSAMVAAFLSQVNADQAASGIERDQTQAYAAAHAGVEKLTADLGQLFAGNFSPTGAQVRALHEDSSTQPALPGISYNRPDGTSGYTIGYDPDGAGNPRVANPNGSQIAAGPYAGLVGLITPYRIEVTARTAGDAEVKMRREFQTVAIPVFQFGLFSENDLSFFAGPDFSFGGKVHTNQNLFLKQDGTATLTLQDRVTAVGEVVRQRLANGQNTHTSPNVRMARAPGCPAAPAAINANCVLIGLTDGSVQDSVPPATAATPNSNWATISMGNTNGWLRNGRTGARRLDLPIVSDGASPVDLVRRPPTGEVPTSAIGRQRFYNMATLRILLSDRGADLPAGAWRLSGTHPSTLSTAQGAPVAVGTTQTFAAVPTGTAATLRDSGYRNTQGTPTVDGWIQISRQSRDGTWTDVTREILSLGFTGRRLSQAANTNSTSAGIIDLANLANDCFDPHPNAIIRLQRVADTVQNNWAGCHGQAMNLTNINNDVGRLWPNVLYDPREGFLRDDQTATGRPTVPTGWGSGSSQVYTGQARMYWGGVMHYVEFDVNNFRRWLRNEIGAGLNPLACYGGGGGGNCPMDITGYVVYFSDRRTNRNWGTDNNPDPANYTVAGGWTFANDVETGEFGFEDNINPANATSVPNNTLDAQFTDALNQVRFAEDLNARDDLPRGCRLPDAPGPCTDIYTPTLERYGQSSRLLPAALNISATGVTPTRTPESDQYELFADATPRPIDRNVARVNRAYFFRRALKLVNGGRGNLPVNQTQGLTVASENPVYVQGNYNACTNAAPNHGNGFNPACTGGVGFGNTPGTDHVSAAIIADAVTLLSNAWNDIRSFVNPYDASIGDYTSLSTAALGSKYHARQATQTWYRTAIIAGKGLNFQRPTSNTSVDHSDFGNDGGAHNFLRYIENWSGVALNYRGSLISFYTSRQAVGTYKCCDVVYGAPSRGYNFDTDFLSPPLLPPRTPMFRDLNTLTFRQILRPTQ